MESLCVTVFGISCRGCTGFRVLSPVLQPLSIFFIIIYYIVFQLILLDIKVRNAEKESLTKT